MHGMLAKVKEERAQRALSQWKHTAVKPAGGGPASAPDASPVPGGASGAPAAASVPPPARGKQSASALKTSALAPAMMAKVASKRSVAIDAKSTPMEAAAGGASASTAGPAPRLDSLGSNRAERLGKSKGRKSARSLYNDDEFAPTPR